MLREGSIWRELKVLMPFLSDQKNWKAPSQAHFFPKQPNLNFEIAILFSIVEKPRNYVFGEDLIPQVPGGGAANYELLPLFT